jgi:subtilase family serine protease
VEELESRTLLSVLTPVQVRHAYGFDQIAFSANGRSIAGDGTGQTIAIVDAYDDPNIASDLKAFDSKYNLPNPTFVKATPEGQPRANAGWSTETALDVEWAHAIAPGADILLVESKSSSLTDLLNAVNYARNQPSVSAVSISWGAGEFAGETQLDRVHRPNGVTQMCRNWVLAIEVAAPAA